MSDVEVRPNQQAETVPDFPRNDLGEIINGTETTIEGYTFEVGLTLAQMKEIVDEDTREAQVEINFLLGDIHIYLEALGIQLGGAGRDVDPAITREAEELVKILSNNVGEKEIVLGITSRLSSVNDEIAEIAIRATSLKNLFTTIYEKEIAQADLEEDFETDIESPLSWSPENWQQVASMTPEEQEYFAGKKKQSNSAKRVWARRANEMLHDTMLEQAIIDTERLGGNPKNVNLKTPNYNYQEWQIIKPLAEQADRANSMLYASMLEEARIEAEAQGKNAGDVRVEKPNYTYEEWKAMEVIHAAIKERQSDAAKRGWATRMNAELPSGEEYTYKQWKDIEAFVKAEKGGAEVDQSLDVSAD